MMSSVTDRPYCGKSIYRRRRVFLSRALCVLLANFVTHNTKPCFMTFHDISSETLSECSVDVFLLFAQDCKQHSHSSEARLAAGFHSVQRWEEGRRLNYMLVWIPWNGLLITPEQAWLKFIGGPRHTMAGVGTNCSPAPSRRYINCTFQSIGVQRCSSISRQHSGPCDTASCVLMDLCTVYSLLCVRGRAGACSESPATPR